MDTDTSQLAELNRKIDRLESNLALMDVKLTQCDTQLTQIVNAVNAALDGLSNHPMASMLGLG